MRIRQTDSELGGLDERGARLPSWIDRKIPMPVVIGSFISVSIFCATLWFGMQTLKDSMLQLASQVSETRADVKAALTEISRMNIANASQTAETRAQLRDHERRLTFLEAQMQKVRP